MRYHFYLLMSGLFLIGISTTAVYSRELTYISVLAEANDPNGRLVSGKMNSFGVSIEEYKEHGGLVIYYGATLQRLESDVMISEYGNPYTMYPVYGYTGFRPNWRVAPYAEFGVDLIDVFLDNGAEGDNVAVDSTVDTFVAGGLKIEITESVMVSAYMKQYFIRPYVLPSSRFNVVGASLFIRLD